MKSRQFAPLLLAVLATGLIGCGKKEEPQSTAAAPAAAAEVIVKVGSVSPLTGPQAHLGKDQENGVRLALDEANAQGITLGGQKVRFQLLSEDDQADPRTATVVAQKLADGGVKGVIGHLNSGTTIPASKIYSDAGIVQISPSATAVAYTAQGFKTAFRIMTNDAQQGKVLGAFAATRAKKIAIIDDRTAYGQGLADEFEKAAKAAGATIVAREFTTDRSTDFMAILTSIKGKKPELVFFGGMDAQAGPMAKQLKSLGLQVPLLGGDGMQTAEFLKLAGVDAEGMIASSPGLPLDKMPGGKAFTDKFGAKYGKIQLYAPYAYDAAAVMVAAMKQANSFEPAAWQPALAKIEYQGVTGKVAFDDKGDIRDGTVTLYQVKGGAWQPLEPAAPAAQ